MATILLHDQRVVVSSPPRSDLYKQVRATESIEAVIRTLGDEISNRLGRQGGHTLNILAHGGPNGVLLASPGLSQFNVGVFLPLLHKVSRIVFHTCAATAVSPGARGYNGLSMCAGLSAVVECTVIGADRRQFLNIDRFLNAGNNVEYAPWEGEVSVFQNGNLIRTNSPYQREAGVRPI